MKSLDLCRYALFSWAAVAMLAGCGGVSGTPLNPLPAGLSAERAQVRGYRVLYSFKGGSKDGAFPNTALANVNGTLYGTTAYGGGRIGSYYLCCGTVYSITASGKERVLHIFKGGSRDGALPYGGLLDVNGTLYGTTASGGSGSCHASYSGCGTVFSITTSGKETLLYSFKGGTIDGQNPQAALINVKGILYGTTNGGGAHCSSGNACGTVFSITTSGKETLLYSFKGGTADGQNPEAALIDVKGMLYGTTNGGGAHCGSGSPACGTVFAITPSGKETLVYSFKGGTTDGQNPEAALIDVKGMLYGTNTGAGAYGDGTAFAITRSGTETVLHSFGNGDDGEKPQAALLDMNGALYGTTLFGGVHSYGPGGTVVKISTSGEERVLHSFVGDPDGYLPVASLINVKGTLYGTTSQGGSVYCPTSGYLGCGTVFALKP